MIRFLFDIIQQLTENNINENSKFNYILVGEKNYNKTKTKNTE